ncbi:aminoglycoside phosphotransferase [Bacillus thuringiensis]|uniref:Aminoglycoside phosphotransferase n=2 Tax=Bacillus cereus group TaxID=86661 RepID=A0A9X6Z2T4_BACTU|nr:MULTISPECIES: phosphotransferase [Bacillus]AJQ57331.1 aminoglycoside phosphotransferase [Bacillus thuringiensis serovar morrisoni]AMR83095.1 aminoglycoside phosphotransferase [Bacillus thuringiensis]EOO05145.1 protein kinase [Bacillus cereus str. Schrouff]EOO82913.1 protein kinase [Bacillus cereus K-5975c]EOP96631.1 protein kinase [Bacillus cereus HuB4-4]
MEIAVERVFTKEILRRAAKAFHVTVEEKPLGDFENYIFKAKGDNDEDYVLRLTHSSHRSKKEVEAELDFLRYVAEHGAKVAGPLNSTSQNLVEEIGAEDSTFFFASLFTYAKGEQVKGEESPYWGEAYFEAWGKAIGQLHRLTMSYPKTDYRDTWEEDESGIVNELEDDQVKKIAAVLMDEIKALPVERETFGLMHGDIHPGNFHYDGKELTIFDFDDAAYNYFIHDLAMVLYYSILFTPWTAEEKTDFARKQLQVLRKGYEHEHRLADSWYESLPLFLRLRDVGLYGTLQKKFKGKGMPDNFRELSEELYERIIKREAIVNI